jgi:hypothetical protein
MIRFAYTLRSHGWARAVVGNENAEASVSASYLSDALGDFVEPFKNSLLKTLRSVSGNKNRANFIGSFGVWAFGAPWGCSAMARRNRFFRGKMTSYTLALK